MQTRDALDMARDRDLDLILVAPQAQPPVCRIMDYGKFKYEKSKKEKDAHKKSASSDMKMVRLHPQTSENDRQVLVRHSERFLRSGHKVRVICRFKGRENAHPEIGRQQMDAVSGSLSEFCVVEGPIIKQGRDMVMNLAPKPGLKPLVKPVKEGKKGKRAEVHDEEAHDDAEFERLQQQVISESGGDAEAAAEAEAHGDEAVEIESAPSESTSDEAISSDEAEVAATPS
jgi:translation initiation factor IF-3